MDAEDWDKVYDETKLDEHLHLLFCFVSSQMPVPNVLYEHKNGVAKVNEEM